MRGVYGETEGLEMAAVRLRGARHQEFPRSKRPEDRFEPAVADMVGEFFGVAWTTPASVRVRFFDLDGMVDPVMPQNVDVTEGEGRVLSGAAMTAGGAGAGYAVAWRTITGGDGASVNLRLRYVCERGFAGGEVAVTQAAPGVLRRRLMMSGYDVASADGSASHDGINLIWVESDPSDVAAGRMSWDAFDSGFGRIMLQRYVVAVDRAGYPTADAAPIAVGAHGAIGGARTEALDLGACGDEPIGRDPITAVLGSGETVIAWIDRQDMLRARILPPAGGGGAPTDLSLDFESGAAEPKVAQIAALGEGRFVLGWLGAAADAPERMAVLGRICVLQEDGAWRAGRTQTLQSLTQISDGLQVAWALRSLVEEDGFQVIWRPGAGDVLSQRFDRYGAARIEGRAIHRVAEDGGDRSSAEEATLVAPVGERMIALHRHTFEPDVRARILRRRGDSGNLPALRKGRSALPVSAFWSESLSNTATGRALSWIRRAAPKWGDDSTTHL